VFRVRRPAVFTGMSVGRCFATLDGHVVSDALFETRAELLDTPRSAMRFPSYDAAERLDLPAMRGGSMARAPAGAYALARP
jgi:hypothetical protein